MTELTDAERESLLVPCACGHTINDHGTLVGCWRCEDEGDECAESFEALLVERLDQIIAARVDKVFHLTLSLAAARLDLTAADNEDGGVDMDAQVYRAAAEIVRGLAPPT